MPLSCFCFGQRPGSPNGETVVRAKELGAAGALKVGGRSNDENLREPLIGTAVEPADGVKHEEAPAEPASQAPAAGDDSGAADDGRPLLEGATHAASDEPTAVADTADAVAGGAPAAGAAAEPQLDAVEQPELGDAAAAEPGEGGDDTVAAESSRTALLSPAEEVSLLQPRVSRLSALLSCSISGTAGDASERQSKQQPTPRVAHATAQQHGAALAPEAALLPRGHLPPLAQPEAALADAAAMLGRQEPGELLAALLTIRRVAIHHHHLIAGSLEDAAALLLECLHSAGDPAAGQAAVMAMLDLLVSFGSAALRVMEAQQAAEPPQPSCLLGLLLAAALGRTAAIRHWANEALNHMAMRMAQGRVVRLLEPYIEHGVPAVRQVASRHLMRATYRRPDAGSPTRR